MNENEEPYNDHDLVPDLTPSRQENSELSSSEYSYINLIDTLGWFWGPVDWKLLNVQAIACLCLNLATPTHVNLCGWSLPEPQPPPFLQLRKDKQRERERENAILQIRIMHVQLTIFWQFYHQIPSACTHTDLAAGMLWIQPRNDMLQFQLVTAIELRVPCLIMCFS